MDRQSNHTFVAAAAFLIACIVVSNAYAYSNEPAGFGGMMWGAAIPADMKLLKEDPVTFDRVYVRPTDGNALGGVRIDSASYTFNFMNEFYRATISGKGWDNYEKLIDYLEKTHGRADESDADMKSSQFVWRGQNTVIVHYFESDPSPGVFTLTYTGVKVVEKARKGIEDALDFLGGSKEGGKEEDPYKGLFD